MNATLEEILRLAAVILSGILSANPHTLPADAAKLAIDHAEALVAEGEKRFTRGN